MWKFLTGLWAWIGLRESIKSNNRPPQRYPEPGPDVDLPVYRDKYLERNSDLNTQAIELKVREAVSRLKSEGKF
jgi:hypothetical protein